MARKYKLSAISLTPVEREIVNAENQIRGLDNFSGTLRMIIREWAAAYKPSYLPPAPTIKAIDTQEQAS